MSNPFEIQDINRDWAVVWPSFDDNFSEQMKFNLLECIFNEINCDEVGLGIADEGREGQTIMWVSKNSWQQDLTDEYTRYLYKYYRIGGAVFHSLNEAKQFKDILEKRYVWQVLQT